MAPRLDAKPSVYGEPLISAPTAVLGVAIAAAAVKGYNAVQFYRHGPSQNDLVKHSAKITQAQYDSIANDKAAKLFIYHAAKPVSKNSGSNTSRKGYLKSIRAMDIDAFYSFATNSNIQRDFMSMDNDKRERFVNEFVQAHQCITKGLALLQTASIEKPVSTYTELSSDTNERQGGITVAYGLKQLEELDKAIEHRKSMTSYDQSALELLDNEYKMEKIKKTLQQLDNK